jgi:hypothetical protein
VGRSERENAVHLEAKAFVLSRDFVLSKRSYQDMPFNLAWWSAELGYFRHGRSFTISRFGLTFRIVVSSMLRSVVTLTLCAAQRSRRIGKGHRCSACTVLSQHCWRSA